MSNESEGSAVLAGGVSAESPRPRRIRLAKAMAAAGRTKRVRAPKALPQSSPPRTCKLSPLEELRLDLLKRRLGGQGIRVKKGELLRAALRVLLELDDARIREAVASLDQDAPDAHGLAS